MAFNSETARLAELYVYGNIIEQDWKNIILLTRDTLAKMV